MMDLIANPTFPKSTKTQNFILLSDKVITGKFDGICFWYVVSIDNTWCAMKQGEWSDVEKGDVVKGAWLEHEYDDIPDKWYGHKVKSKPLIGDGTIISLNLRKSVFPHEVNQK